MTIRPAIRRLFAWTAPPLGFGALALVAKSSGGLPVWVVVFGAAIGGGVSTMSSVLPALLPQKSEHRRDVWRDWLHHRERMARLRITTTAGGDLRPLRDPAAVDTDEDDERSGAPGVLRRRPTGRRRTARQPRGGHRRRASAMSSAGSGSNLRSSPSGATRT